MKEVLIVEDERILRNGLKDRFTGEGYAVRTAKDGLDALAEVSARRPDLVLLDVMMPKMNGFRCCEEIRKTDAQLPVIFLTAKDSEADQVRGLGLGADDYVSKDAGEAVLLARVARALARAQGDTASSAAAKPNVIRLGTVSVDRQTLTVYEDGKESARLTKTEADLLSVLASQRGNWFAIDDLITELRGNGFACEDAMLYSHMSRLRQKLGSASSLLKNRRDVGYCLTR